MRLVFPLAAFLFLTGGLACQSNEQPADYVARVSDTYLTEADVEEVISDYSTLRDTASAREHIIDSWITEQLLYREARRQGMRGDSTVQQRLQEVRRSVLIDALVENLKEDIPPPSETSIQTYYQRHAEQFRLREPFIRLRYISDDQADTLDTFRAQLAAAADSATIDSLWQNAPKETNRTSRRTEDWNDNYLPLSRLERELPVELLELETLESGAVSPVVQHNDNYHLVQITDRMEAGTLPSLEHVRDKIIQQLLIQEKKLMYTREVQRLRTRARADNSIDIRH
jgi:hypothetical protein